MHRAGRKPKLKETSTEIYMPGITVNQVLAIPDPEFGEVNTKVIIKHTIRALIIGVIVTNKAYFITTQDISQLSPRITKIERAAAKTKCIRRDPRLFPSIADEVSDPLSRQSKLLVTPRRLSMAVTMNIMAQIPRLGLMIDVLDVNHGSSTVTRLIPRSLRIHHMARPTTAQYMSLIMFLAKFSCFFMVLNRMASRVKCVRTPTINPNLKYKYP